MIFEPHIIQNDGTREVLSKREIRVNSDNFAIARYRKRLHYVSNDYEILFREQSPAQNDYKFVNNLNGVKFFKKRTGQNTASTTTIRRKAVSIKNPPKNNSNTNLASILSLSSQNVPSAEALFSFSEMGLDDAVISLKYMSKYDKKYEARYRQALGKRPRYTSIDEMLPGELLLNARRSMKISPVIYNLPLRYCTYPLNSAHFRSMMEQHSTSRVKDYFQKSFSELGFRGRLRRETAQKYLDANIFFHNSIFNESPETFVEKCTLDYDPSITETVTSGAAFEIKSEDYYRVTERWARTTKDRIKLLQSDLLRRLLRDSCIGDLTNNETQTLAFISIYSLAAIRFDSTITNRIKSLHKLGLRQLGHINSI